MAAPRPGVLRGAAGRGGRGPAPAPSPCLSGNSGLWAVASSPGAAARVSLCDRILCGLASGRALLTESRNPTSGAAGSGSWAGTSLKVGPGLQATLSRSSRLGAPNSVLRWCSSWASRAYLPTKGQREEGPGRHPHHTTASKTGRCHPDGLPPAQERGPPLLGSHGAVWPGDTFLPPEPRHPVCPGGSPFRNFAASPALPPPLLPSSALSPRPVTPGPPSVPPFFSEAPTQLTLCPLPPGLGRQQNVMPAFRSGKGGCVPVEQLSLGLSQASRGAHTLRESEKGLRLAIQKNFPVLNILFLMKLSCYYVEVTKI
nr:uncharacterized protein LOC123854449 [Mirounga angustirostris]